MCAGWEQSEGFNPGGADPNDDEEDFLRHMEEEVVPVAKAAVPVVNINAEQRQRMEVGVLGF